MKLTDLLNLIRIDTLFANAAYYFLGVTLAFILTDSFSLVTLIGLTSFILTYSSLYVLNDIMDKEYDKKHIINWKKEKPIPSGIISIKTAVFIDLTLIMTGLVLAFFVNKTFLLLIIVLNALSISYSLFKLKNHYVSWLVILLSLQLIKIFLGWASISNDITKLPLLLIISISLFYTYAISIYKEKVFGSRIFKLVSKTLLIIGLIIYFYETVTNKVLSNALLVSLIIFLIGVGVFYKKFLKSKNLSKFSRIGIIIVLPSFLLLLISMLLLLT